MAEDTNLLHPPRCSARGARTILSSGLVALALAAPLVLAGCTQEAESGQAAAQAQSGGQSSAQAKASAGHLVELAPVTMDTLQVTSIYTGSLRHRNTVRIFNQEEGRVTRLPFYEGDTVRSGEVVLELDGTLIEAELRKARAVRHEAEANVQRLKRLVERRVASEDEYLRAQTLLEVAKAEESTLETRLGYTRVRAPFTGLVTARKVEPGDVVTRHTHVLTVVDPSSLITELEVSELLIPHISPGDRVAVRIDALGTADYRGEVRRIHPELNPQTRQGVVEVELEPVPAGARAGQFVRVVFTTEALDKMVVPFAALRRDRDGEFVFRIGESRKAERVAVLSGRRLADKVEMLDGLEVGDAVVIRGFLGLTEGKKVTAVEPNANTDGAAPPTGTAQSPSGSG